MPVVKKDDGTINWAESLIEDADGTVDVLRQVLRQDRNQDEGEQKWWNTLYTEAGDLVGDEDLVKKLFNQHIKKIIEIRDDKGLDASRHHLIEVARKDKDAQIRYWNATKEHRVMSGNLEGPGVRLPPPESMVSSVDIYNARRERRRNAQQGFLAGGKDE